MIQPPDETRNLISATKARGLPQGYDLTEGTPPIPAYLALREKTGLSTKTEEQACAALPGSWYAVHIRHSPALTIVGMGRVIGDGGWYFHINDMAVLPEHQRRGVGDAIMAALTERILDCAPPTPYVNLVADEAGRGLYAKWGFGETGSRSVGMERRFDGSRPL